MSLNLSLLWQQGWPLLILTSGAFLSLLTAVLPRKLRLDATAWTAVLSFAASGVGFFLMWKKQVAVSSPFLIWDPFGNFLGMLVCCVGLATVCIAARYWQEQEEALPELYLLLIFAVLGMALMVSTTQLITLVFGLEVMSLSLYVLVALRRGKPESSEASFKYFLLGSVVTAFLLFGIALIYGATATLDLWKIAESTVVGDRRLLLKLGSLLLLMAFAFKVAAVPLHFWAPDVYDGAPAPITGFMATGVKIAAFGALIRIVQALLPFEFIPTQKVILGLSLATMIVGNFTALRQRSLKRIMAYSSIAHAGYLLLGVATLIGPKGFVAENIAPILFYFISYAILTLGAFSVLTVLSAKGKEIGELKDLDGLANQHPILAALLGLFLISLAGIPPTAGFLAKYYLFLQAIRSGLYLYAVLGILASAVSLYYYLAPVVRMYFRSAERPASSLALTWPLRVLMVVLAMGVFYLGIWPSQGVKLSRETTISRPSTVAQGL